MMIMMMLLEEGVSWIAKQVQKDKKEKDPKFLFIHEEPLSLPPFVFMDDDDYDS